jgi:hypothetical protein
MAALNNERNDSVSFVVAATILRALNRAFNADKPQEATLNEASWSSASLP